MKIELTRCDKCKDIIERDKDTANHISGPWIEWDLCKKCFERLIAWVGEDEDDG